MKEKKLDIHEYKKITNSDKKTWLVGEKKEKGKKICESKLNG